MKQRVITAIIALALFIPVLILHNTVLLTIVMALLAAIAVYELTTCISAPMYLRIIGAGVAAVIPVVADNNILGDYITEVFRRLAFPAALFAAAVFTLLYWFRPKRQPLATYIAAVLYPAAGLGLVVYYARYSAFPMIFLMFFIVSWVTDSFAMLSGSMFGKRKLCPFLSPKKTVEGAIGGTVAAVFAFVIYGIIVDEPLLECAILGLILSAAAQCGDLLASALKRAYGIKDFGKLFPGHGGVMDRFDSMLLVAHVFNIYSIIKILLI